MSKSILNKIEEIYTRFSKSQKRIADFIISDFDKAAFMTAAKLGTTVKTSESTVVRFATKLGYEGYPQLQKELQEVVKSRLTSVQRMEVSANNMTDDIVSEVLVRDVEMIRETLDLLSHKDFYGAVDAINKAGKIYIIGVRSSSLIAFFAHYYLNLIYDNVVLIDTAGECEMFEQVFRITENDVCLAISFPRYSQRAVNVLSFIHDKGAEIISLTDSEISPISNYADYLLIAKSNIASIVDSMTAPLSVINALIAACARSRQEEIKGTLNALEQIWDKYNVYENFGDKEQ